MEEALWLAVKPTGKAVYDFTFDQFLPCRRPYRLPDDIAVIARVGAPPDYDAFFNTMSEFGAPLINTPAEHLRASDLRHWYPLLSDLTPCSIVYDKPPSAAEVEHSLGWPVFVKGARQTSKHRKDLSIAGDAQEFEKVMTRFMRDPILGWQKIVVRKLEALRIVDDSHPTRLPACFEFRVFIWHGQVAGIGPYWTDATNYSATRSDEEKIRSLALEVARRLNVPFLVVDIAQSEDGRWIVIECNDGQESGYTGISPFALWQSIVTLERCNEG